MQKELVFKVKVGSEQHILIKNFPILVTTDGPKTFVFGHRCGRHSHKLRNHAMNQFIVVAQEAVLDVVNVWRQAWNVLLSAFALGEVNDKLDFYAYLDI